MTPIALHPIIFYLFLFILVLFMGGFTWVLWLYLKLLFMDCIIFIDKSNRWLMIRDKLKDSSTYSYGGKKYIIGEGILNKRGKALHIFSENKPNALDIKYNTAKWLSSESLMSVINNKLIQQLVRTSDTFTDKLILFGALGGILAGISSAIILLKQFGVI